MIFKKDMALLNGLALLTILLMCIVLAVGLELPSDIFYGHYFILSCTLAFNAWIIWIST